MKTIEQLEKELAYIEARCRIEANCDRARWNDDGVPCYRIDRVDADGEEDVEEAVQYLEHRGLLVKYGPEQSVVKILPDDGKGAS